MTRPLLSLLPFAVLLAACAGGSPQLPYPAFIQVDELEDVFLANLPGVRAKQLAGDPQTRRSGSRVDLPPDWSGTSGGSPGRSLEIFVLEGALKIADIELPPGGYAYLPAGSLGFNLEAERGARVLYFVSDVEPGAVIRAPIILDSALLPWQPGDVAGVTTRELRRDPGTGSGTWLERIEPGASLPWVSSSALREGYLVSGDYRHSECLAGEVHTAQYLPGGYFYRPADTLNGGPEAGARAASVWLLRESERGMQQVMPGCVD